MDNARKGGRVIRWTQIDDLLSDIDKVNINDKENHDVREMQVLRINRLWRMFKQPTQET